MPTIVTGIVTNGVVIPASPLPEGMRVEVHLNAEAQETLSGTRMRPSEFRKLPREQQDAILAKAAALAEKDYREDKELTGFDAFSEELDDDSE